MKFAAKNTAKIIAKYIFRVEVTCVNKAEIPVDSVYPYIVLYIASYKSVTACGSGKRLPPAPEQTATRFIGLSVSV